MSFIITGAGGTAAAAAPPTADDIFPIICCGGGETQQKFGKSDGARRRRRDDRFPASEITATDAREEALLLVNFPNFHISREMYERRCNEEKEKMPLVKKQRPT